MRRFFAVRALASTMALVIVVGFGTAKAEDEKKKELEIGKWYPTLELGFNLTQSAYSNNWGGGDNGSVVWSTILNSTLENQLSRRVNWSNQLKLAFGQTHQQKVQASGVREWEKPEKSTDLIDFETLFRFTLDWFVDPYVSGRLESQFIDASDGFGRNLTFNPIKVKEATGFAREFIQEENRNLLTRLGFALRQTSRRFFSAAPPSDATQSETTNDGGIEFVTDYKTKILEDKVAWTAKLTVFQPFFYSASNDFDRISAADVAAAGLDADVKDFTTMVDVDWENIFTTQITKVVSVNLYVRFVYDKYDNSVPPEFDDTGALTNGPAMKAAIRKAGQIKQTMSIGVTYRFL